MLKNLLALGCLLLATSANALLINHSTYTTDTSSNLDWLHLSLTAGRSYEDIVSATSNGGDLEGWTLAGFKELFGFFDGAGGDGSYYDSSELAGGGGYGSYTHNDKGVLFSSLVNTWGAGLSRRQLWAFVAGLGGDPSTTSGVILSDDGRIETSIGTFSQSSSGDSRIGAALFRQNVPEPGSLWLLAFGMVVLIIRRGRPSSEVPRAGLMLKAEGL